MCVRALHSYLYKFNQPKFTKEQNALLVQTKKGHLEVLDISAIDLPAGGSDVSISFITSFPS